MTGMTPDDWFSICLIGAPDSRMLLSSLDRSWRSERRVLQIGRSAF